MAKEDDQTQQTEEQTGETATATLDKEPDENVKAAFATSEKFDELIDEKGIAGDEPFDDDEQPEEKPAETHEEPKPDESEQKDDQQQRAEQTAQATGVSQDLREKALDAGLTEDEIGRFDDDTGLQKTLDIIEKVVAGSGDDETPAQEQKESSEEPEEGFEFEFENRDDIDPELLDNIEKMQSHYEGQIKSQSEQITQLSGKVDRLLAETTKKEQDEFVEKFDGMVDKLGLEWAEVFGKGGTRALEKSSRAWENRDAVRARMHAFATGLVQSGGKLPTDEDLFDMALHSLHKEKLTQVQDTRTQAARTKRAKQRTGRPATKTTGQLTPEQKAYETSRKFDELIDTSEV
jgi:hypothetical protein